MAISLISNTGIQFYKTHIQFRWDEFRTKFHFYQESYREEVTNSRRLRLKVAEEVSDTITGQTIYVFKDDLKKLEMLDSSDPYEKFKGVWNGNSDIRIINANDIIEARPSSLQRSILRGEQPVLTKFFGQWLPFPCFGLTGSQTGPYNWVRVMAVPKNYDEKHPERFNLSGIQDWNVVLAFDTTAVFDNGNYNEQFRETPLFASKSERAKGFCFPVSDLKLMNFVAPENGNRTWIDSKIMKLVHNTSDINVLQGLYDKETAGMDGGTHKHPLYQYMADYLYFLHVIASKLSNERVELVNNMKTTPVNVELVVDIGNSKTTAVLFQEGRFDKVEMLELQDFSHPFLSEKSPFDMNVVFDRADFGICKIVNSKQFSYPSLVRLGKEATYLRYQAGFEKGKGESQSTCSSPKRYLWDKHPSPFEWQNIRHGDAEPTPIDLIGITNQFNGNGALVSNGVTMGGRRYSRRSLMTFAFLEILAQSFRQINGQKFREDRGGVDNPRRISKIIVTCPTAMSMEEQIELRTAAAEAYIVMERYHKATKADELTLLDPAVYLKAINSAPVMPSVPSLKNRNDNYERTWVYDEATCVQFVYLCAEIAVRYRNNCAAFFNRYGKQRNDLFVQDDTGKEIVYPGKTLTVGSVDIGAGTTDVMICSYKYQKVGQTTLIPVPRYWESFYMAGDDIMKKFVQKFVIEGDYSMVEHKLKDMKVDAERMRQLIIDFFGADAARMTYNDRQIRREFCQQISIPVAQCYMELTSKGIDKCDLSWNDIFNGNNKPNQLLLDCFAEHFGFRLEEQTWHFDLKIATQFINDVMESLIKTISRFLAEYECDVVLLAGRPCSLKPIIDLFIKNYPVDPSRLKVLKDYRVGQWYPFQHQGGYFEDQKSIVAVGAMVGYLSSEQGGYKEMSINLSALSQQMLPTTKYIGLMADTASPKIPDNDILLTPEHNMKNFEVPSIPIRLGVRQFNTDSYPARSLYTLDFDDDAIRNEVIADRKEKKLDVKDEAVIQDSISVRKGRIRRFMPVNLEIERDYLTDREHVEVTRIEDNNGKIVSRKSLSLQIKSLSESDAFWMDIGAFKTQITAKN